MTRTPALFVQKDDRAHHAGRESLDRQHPLFQYWSKPIAACNHLQDTALRQHEPSLRRVAVRTADVQGERWTSRENHILEVDVHFHGGAVLFEMPSGYGCSVFPRLG